MFFLWPSIIFPFLPFCSLKMEIPVKNPLLTKYFQLRHKSGLYHFYLLAVNVIFLRGAFCKLWPWLFGSYCFQTRHALHLPEPGNMSWPNYGVCEEQTDQLSSRLFPKIALKWCMCIMWWLFVWSGEMTVKPGREEGSGMWMLQPLLLLCVWPKEMGEGYWLFCPTLLNQACFDLWFLSDD